MTEKKKKTHHKKADTKEGKGGNTKMLLLGIGSFFVALVIVFYIIGFVGVRNASENSLVLQSAKVFDIPVASIDGMDVSYADYHRDMETLRKFYANAPEGFLPATDEQISEQVLTRLIENELVVTWAEEYGVSVEQEDIDAVRESMLSQFANEDEANEESLKLFGIDMDTYVEQVVVPMLLEQKVQTAYAEQNQEKSESNDVVREFAQGVLGRIKDGESFRAMAKEFGTDGTAEQGGDLGWFGRGVMVPPFEEAVFALEAGELGPELVESQFGYHIVRVDDRRDVNPDTGEEVEEVSARHILFRFEDTNADAYLQFKTDRLMAADIEMYADIRNPYERPEQEELYEEMMQVTEEGGVDEDFDDENEDKEDADEEEEGENEEE